MKSKKWVNSCRLDENFKSVFTNGILVASADQSVLKYNTSNYLHCAYVMTKQIIAIDTILNPLTNKPHTY